MRSPGPLWRRSALRLLRGGPWGLLVVGAFTLLGAAAAATAPFTEAAANAGLATVLATVPQGASAAQSPVVRVVGGSTSPQVADQQLTAARVAAVPGLGPVSLSGFSVGAEIDPDRYFTCTVAVGDRTADVRLAAVPDPAARLVPATASGAGAGGAAADGIWLPAPVARQLRVAPGATVTMKVGRGVSEHATATTTTLAGVYAVDGALPRDPAGSTFWVSHRGELPTLGRYSLTPAWLAVARVPVAQALADDVGDQLLWAVEAAPVPGVPTLGEYARTAAAVDWLRFLLRDPRSGVETSGILRTTVASGLPDLVARAEAVSQATQARVATLGRAALALAGGVVLAAALLGLARRRPELRLSVTLGLGPARVAGLAAVEHLPAAVVGATAGTALAALLVVSAGPPGTVTAASVAAGAAAAGGAAVVAVLAVAVLWAGAHLLAARRRREHRRRSVPWESLLAVAAATATFGLVTTTDAGGTQGALALLVPLLLLAGIGAVGGRLAVAGLGRLLGTRAGRLPATRPGRRGAARRTARWLALRRLAAPSRERSAVVAVLTTGAGLLLFAQAAAASTTVTIDDRVAVAAGAAATVDLPGSWSLDPGAPAIPEGLHDPASPDYERPVPGVRNPPLGPGRSVVWRTRVGDPTAFGTLDVLVVDPATFAQAAQWGSGPELAQARRLVDRLGEADARAVRALQSRAATPVPVIAVGYPPGRVGDQLTIEPAPRTYVTVEVVGAATAFPGLAGLPMLVAPAGALFRAIPGEDPRLAPPPNSSPSSFPTVRLWDALGREDAAGTLASHDIRGRTVATAEAVRRQPELEAARQALPYQRALGWGAALVALVAFALYVDRTVSLAGAADLLLARVGLGATGVRRSRVLEPVVMTVLAGALAVVAVLLLRPLAARLLDPQRSAVPAFVLTVDARVVALGVAFLAVAALLAAGVTLARQRSLSADRALRDG